MRAALDTIHGRHAYLLMAASSAKSYLLNARRTVFQPRMIETEKTHCGCFHFLGARAGFPVVRGHVGGYIDIVTVSSNVL